MMKPRTTFIALKQLQQYPEKLQQTALLLRFLRLTHFIPQRKNQLLYLSLIRQRIENPYDHRLSLILNKECSNTPEQRLQRKLNTLSLLNHALTGDELSKKIFMNLIQNEESKTEYIKRLTRNDRVVDVRFQKMEYFNPKWKHYNGLMSLREFDKFVMMLNESLDMEL